MVTKGSEEVIAMSVQSIIIILLASKNQKVMIGYTIHHTILEDILVLGFGYGFGYSFVES